MPLFIAITLLSSFLAQSALAPGIISGHITCADTNKPPAAVKLFLTSTASLSDHTYPVAIQPDGDFIITNIPPGTYYLRAAAFGYVDPYTLFSARDLSSSDPTIRGRIARVLPTVIIASVPHPVTLGIILSRYEPEEPAHQEF